MDRKSPQGTKVDRQDVVAGPLFLFSERTKLADRRCRRCRFALFPARLPGPPVPRWVHGRVGATAAPVEHRYIEIKATAANW
jgi:hypothetical protein